MSDTSNTESIFNKKYIEFCNDLLESYPEKKEEITAALLLPDEEKLNRFRSECLNVNMTTKTPDTNPKNILPGVVINDSEWSLFSKNTQKAVNEYLTILSFCCMFADNKTAWTDGAGDADSNNKRNKVLNDMMNQWKDKFNTVDFKSISEKIMKMFGSTDGGFKIPPNLLKGHLAKLVDELIKEFKPEDFGLTPEQIADSETNPSRSFELLMQIYTQKPELLQNAMKRISKKLQNKISRGELKPADLASEAEEMLKTFTDNPAFVDLMETFKASFGFEDKDIAQAAGRDGENRLSIARSRLRAKLEKKLNKNKNK